MTTQTEAQRLAEKLEARSKKQLLGQLDNDAAAELRRLEAENTELQLYKNLAAEFGLSILPDLAAIQARIKALEKANAELIDALGRLMNHVVGMQSCTRDLARARAALAKHGGQQ